MHHLSRQQRLAFTGGVVRIHGSDIKTVKQNDNISYSDILKNIEGENIFSKSKSKYRGGSDGDSDDDSNFENYIVGGFS